MKKCNFCGKDIQITAIKCRYCGNFLDQKNTNTCEKCGNEKDIDSNECKNCVVNNSKNDKVYKNLNTTRLNISMINRILIISLFFIIGILAVFLYNLYFDDNTLTERKKQNIIKSTVKIFSYKSLEEDEGVQGSGVIFSKDGLVLTNSHVVSKFYDGTAFENIEVCLLDNIGEKPNCNYTATLMIRNPILDLAIIKINNYKRKNFIKLFDDQGITINDFGKTIYVYGYPSVGGESLTITTGIISGFDINNNIKTDAEINGGNSGGGGFLGSKYIGIPSSVYYSQSGYGKLGNIISDKQIYSWFNTILKNKKNKNYIYSDFLSSNLILGKSNAINGASINYSNNQKMCYEYHGEFSYYDEFLNDCDCYDGFEWGDDDTCYLTDESISTMIEIGNQDCREQYGDFSYFTFSESKDDFVCDCEEGYNWGGIDGNTCVESNYDSDYDRKTKICQDAYGYGSYFTGEIENDKVMCDCKLGYDWGGNDGNTCILKSNSYNNKIFIDYNKGLMWQVEPLYALSRSDAYNKAYNSSLGNYYDWRLPTSEEIQSLYTDIVNFKCYEKYSDKINYKYGSYWTSSDRDIGFYGWKGKMYFSKNKYGECLFPGIEPNYEGGVRLVRNYN